MVANPPKGNHYKLGRFDEAATVDGIRTAMGGIKCDFLATVPDAIGPPSLDEIAERLTGGRYTLLHLVAHGEYKGAGGETTIYLLDSAGKVAPVAASKLIERLYEVKGALGLPRLAFLATCESAKPEAERAGGAGRPGAATGAGAWLACRGSDDR